MKIAAVSTIKDECDIIELFVRINSSWADHFYVLDNGSSDNTPHILRRLSEEGYPITVQNDPKIDFRQGEMITGLARRAAAEQDFDFIFPIDGDEFIGDGAAFKSALAGLQGEQVASLEWSTLIPNDGSVMQRHAPLFDGFAKRRTEVRRVPKVVIPKALTRTAQIEMGNHLASGPDGRPIHEIPLPLPLFHVPVRSKDQILAKTLIGSHKMSIKLNRKKDEIFHWDLIAERIRSCGHTLSDEQFREIALSYGWSAGDPKVRDTIPVSIGAATDSLKYAELSQVNLPQLLDGFMRQLCNEIHVTRSSASMFKKLLRRFIRT